MAAQQQKTPQPHEFVAGRASGIAELTKRATESAAQAGRAAQANVLAFSSSSGISSGAARNKAAQLARRRLLRAACELPRVARAHELDGDLEAAFVCAFRGAALSLEHIPKIDVGLPPGAERTDRNEQIVRAASKRSAVEALAMCERLKPRLQILYARREQEEEDEQRQQDQQDQQDQQVAAAASAASAAAAEAAAVASSAASPQPLTALASERRRLFQTHPASGGSGGSTGGGGSSQFGALAALGSQLKAEQNAALGEFGLATATAPVSAPQLRADSTPSVAVVSAPEPVKSAPPNSNSSGGSGPSTSPAILSSNVSSNVSHAETQQRKPEPEPEPRHSASLLPRNPALDQGMKTRLDGYVVPAVPPLAAPEPIVAPPVVEIPYTATQTEKPKKPKKPKSKRVDRIPDLDELFDDTRIRQVVVNGGMFNEFIRLAAPNTRRNIETCGLLTGKLSKGCFYITTLLVPPQVGTSDTVQTTDEAEEAIFEFQEKRGLITLGWIHTHPKHECFLSSVDMHTQGGYQTLMKEAVAIVVAPEYRPNFGVFRLKTPPGMDGLGTIQRCPLPGFHPHDRGVYEVATHVDLRWPNQGLKPPPYVVVDIRTRK
jgi:STAM-binding protein